MLRRTSVILLSVVAVGAIALPAAGATTYRTKIIVSLKFPAFHGKLESAKHSCVHDRKVKLFRQKSGPDKLLGTDKSEDHGEWSIPIGKRLTSGAYYAKVTARGNCRSDKSKIIPVD